MIVKVAIDLSAPTNQRRSWEWDFDSFPPYPAKVVEDFQVDDKETEFRDVVREGLGSLRDHSSVVVDQFVAPPADKPQDVAAFREELAKRSKQVGVAQLQLTTARSELMAEAMVKARDKEIKWWQATYDFTLVRLNERLAYLQEYNARIGELRKEFPALNPEVHKGWRLAPRERVVDPGSVKDLQEARRLLSKMALTYKGTPWELVARRERFTSFGLEWLPLVR